MTTLITAGHGDLTPPAFIERCRGAGIVSVVDIRSAPGSRRHPHFGRSHMEEWLPSAGFEYRWEPRLGGFRRPKPDSPNGGLRHAAFRGYADHMATPEFAIALDEVLAQAALRPLAVMCSETLWWRCHRRLVADFAMLVHGCTVLHATGRGTVEPHRLTEGAVLAGRTVRYPAA